jgi:hypothetical protein
VSDAERVLRLLTDAGATQAEIAKACRIPVRSVQDIIQGLRLEGEPIVTNGAGVRLATWAIDVERCSAALRSRAIHQLLTSRALRHTAKRMRAQEDASARLTLWEIAS